MTLLLWIFYFKIGGITALRKLHAISNNIPVLILTAKAEFDDKVLVLDTRRKFISDIRTIF